LNLSGMTAGYGVGSIFRMNIRRRRTLSIEIGMQNAGLGTILALKHFGEEAALPAAVFVFICIITASAAAAIWQKKPPEQMQD
jgi:BASS family bile acid:Na+ symporter